MDHVPHRPESCLLARHCAGDEAAFPELVHLHYAALVRLATHRLGITGMVGNTEFEPVTPRV